VGRIGTMLRRHPRICLVGALLAILVSGYLIGRQVWAQIQYSRAEAELELSLRVQERTHLAESRRLLAGALTVWTDDPRLYFLLARAARRAGDLDEARLQLRRAEQLDWVAEAIDLERTLLAVQQGKFGSKELAGLAAFVRLDHPDKLVILEALVQGCRRTYQLPQALGFLEDWLAVQPDSALALGWQGETLLLLGREQEGLASYRKAVEIDPLDDQSRLKLAELLLGLHKSEEALPHLTELQGRPPDKPEVLFSLALCHSAKGETSEAAALLDRVLALQPNHGGALAERGKLALDDDRPLEAEKWLRRAVEAGPFEREILHTFHRCLVRNKHTAEAEKCEDRIKGIDEDRKRLNQLRSEVMTSPSNPSLRVEIGRILIRNGQDKIGLSWLHSALRLDPNHAPTRQALQDYGKTTGARPPKVGE
jgi:tetratricopeptide (TPR) repeat protein